MMDEGIVIENDGRVVGVAVRVHGGFMFFSTDPDLKVLEATVFPRVEMVTRQVAEIVQAKRSSTGRTAMEGAAGWGATKICDSNVVRLRPRRLHTISDPEPPDAA